jgi:prevent-host-death family protein
MEHDPNRKGNIAELSFAAEAARLGLAVYQPLTEHGRADLVLGIGGQLLRVQCKWGKRKGDNVFVNLETSRRCREGYVRTRYTADEVDAIGVYCDALNSCFLIPIEIVEGKAAVSLRLAPARNGQRAALNWAEQYRLGAVAQLAERRRGTAEARGSNPLSSTTTSNAAVEPTSEEVGAHEFRNHFGYYLERAAAGAEVLVRRRGRPHARLCPPGRAVRIGQRSIESLS